MRFSVVIPWWNRVDCEHRTRALAAVQEHVSNLNCRVVVGVCRSDEWCKAEAVADALDRTDAGVLVLWDADVVCAHDAVLESVRRAVGRGWAIPHLAVRRLTRASTASYYGTGQLPRQGPFDRPPYRGMPAGGLVAVDRRHYERAPFDPRFRGWGHEDEAAGVAWRALVGVPWRGVVPLWHLWHPPQPRLTTAVGSKESYELLQQYRRNARPGKIEPTIKEAKDAMLQMR